MTASSRVAGACASAVRHEDKYGKDYSPDVIFLTLGAAYTIYALPADQHIGNHVSRVERIDTV